jgi:hypothetical protein
VRVVVAVTGPRESHGVLSGLADIRFRRFITPRLISVLYVAVSACIGFGALFALLLVWSVASWMGGGWWWCAPVIIAAGVAGIVCARIGCEWVLMGFTRGRPVEAARPVAPAAPPPPAPGWGPPTRPGPYRR